MLKTLFVRIAMIASVGLWASHSHAQVTNDVVVSGTYGTTTIEAMDDETVSVVAAAPNVQLTKTIDEVIDTNNSGRVDAGDTVVYRFDVLNTGNQTLNEIDLIDPIATFTTSRVGPLDPLDNDTSLTATYVLTQPDVNAGGVENSATAEARPPDNIDGTPQDTIEDVSDAGDENVETAALDGTVDDDTTNDPTVLTIAQEIELDVEKSLVATSQPFPFVFDLTYRISIKNNGNVTATNLVLTDDLVAQLAPGDVLRVTALNPTGSVSVGVDDRAFVLDDVNATFIGSQADPAQTDAAVLISGLSLAPAGAFSIDLEVRVEVPPATFVDGTSKLNNLASLGIDQIAEPFASTTDGAAGPVSITISDRDLDGVVDGEEALAADGDLDGVANSLDADPTGYFYCEEDGAILSGGSISVTALTGDSAAIRIVSDGNDGNGRDGAFQWYVTAAGTYEMTYIPPPGSTISIDRTALPALVAATLGGNFASIGSNEDVNTGLLADFSAAANPYHLVFELAEGDPHILNNNIPLRLCGTSALSVAKTLVDGPTLLADGRIALSYEFDISNIGNSRVTDIGATDPLDEVFGAGRFEVVSLDVTAAPDSFAGVSNANFNGSSDTALLSSGGYLESGEDLTLKLALIVDPAETAAFENTVTATGLSANGVTVLDPVTASASILLLVNDLENELLISKTAQTENVRVGDVLTYTVEVENTSALDLAGLNLVDRLPEGIQYRQGTAFLDAVSDEPDRVGRVLRWDDFEIDAGQTRVLTLQTLIGSQAGPGDIVNEAWVENALTGRRITKIARATVRIAIEPIFDCSAVIGKVFDDRNLNGYQDPAVDVRSAISDQADNVGTRDREGLEYQQRNGEPGLPNVNILTATGTVITTDEFGRFSIPCAELPDASGTNFSLKVDERTLPSGYHVVTENPRTMRLTAGIFAELNFGAALGDVIDIDLTAAAFDGSNRPVAGLENSLRQLRQQVGDTYTLIRLSYYYQSEGVDVARQRLDSAEALFEQVWQGSRRNSLEIERSVYAAQ